MASQKNNVLFLFLLACNAVKNPLFCGQADNTQVDQTVDDQKENTTFIINKIEIEGLSVLPEDTIFSKIPYEIGEHFDKNKTNKIINDLYGLGYFTQIKILTVPVGKDKVDVHVILTEKTPIKKVVFKGNKNVSSKDLKKKLGEIIAAEPRELKKYALALQRYYAEKNRHFAIVTPSLETIDGKGAAVFTIKEGPLALVKKVRFEGNKSFSGKKLRTLLFTREDWILGMLDKSGTYNPLAVEQDRDSLERFYQSNGFMHAKVPGARIIFDEKKKEITITFTIQEGDQYTVSSVKAPGNDLLSEEDLLAIIPVRKGQLYSRELVRVSIEQLRARWGKEGYIYADIDPAIEPDDETKTTSITFYSHPGDKVYLNRVNIFGNEKTRDKVIRRQLQLEEGDLLTTPNMEESKQRIAQLGYFDLKEGVNWKINRINEDTADLDLLVKEVKTGKFSWQMSYGGAPNRIDSSNTGFAVEMSAVERNLLGKGFITQLVGRLGGEEKSFQFSFADPWFCDKPIRVGVDAFLNHSTYDELKQTTAPVGQKQIGSSLNLGFLSKTLDDTLFLFDWGFQKVNHLGQAPRAQVNGDPLDGVEYQLILDERFKDGMFVFLQAVVRRNLLNHHLHITEGYKWDITSRLAIPSFSDNIGFFKIEGDAHWYTSIIGDYQLVLHTHGHFGYIAEFGKNRIPFRELYNIGGPASVRAWRFGQISPLWYASDILQEDWQGEPIGARKAMFVNVELVFPIMQDLSIKGCIFYDGGSGWDTPDANSIRSTNLKNNSFDYRQCIGIGVRVLNPQPMRVDWGIKLDRRPGESLSEVQFSGYYDF